MSLCHIHSILFRAAIILLVVFITHQPAFGETPVYGVEMYTGWSTDMHGQGFGYLGLGIDRTVKEHWAFTSKLFGSYLYYHYDAEPGEIDAEGPGLKLHIGAKYFDPGRFFIITGGLDYRDTSLSPDDRNSRVRGAKTGASVEVMYSDDITDRHVMELLGSYSTIGDSYWGRVRMKCVLSSLPESDQGRRVLAGLEIIGEGNSDYSAFRIGPLVELQLTAKRVSLLLNGGFKHTNDLSGTAYAGIELYRRF